MSQLNFPKNSSFKSPPQRNFTEIPIISTFKETYLLWHSFLTHLPRLTRYTLGRKIDELFVDILELTLTAQYTKREDKLNFLHQLNRKLDNLKFFVMVLWEAKGLDTGKYSQLSRKLSSAGMMLGGWMRNLQSFQKETPAARTGA